MTTTTYTEVATAAGAWCCRVLLPETPFEAVCALLKDLTTVTGTPVTAFLFGGCGDPVAELLLVRDPSRTHGTPEIALYESLAQRLTAETGWSLAPARAPHSGVLVGLGLREGYAPDAPHHAPAEVEQHLAGHGADWSCRTARLVSARLVDGAVQWYDEVGVVVHTPAEMAPTIERIAALFAQHRYVVTDFGSGSTRALAAR
ncbi:hypothetical protein [Saccharothrix sp. HUAS TT1]|uniref:hypothetical protein n=1 Tax=unclassified Saccharothrix TaxID=2593673 RepID=UPI00345C5F0B